VKTPPRKKDLLGYLLTSVVIALLITAGGAVIWRGFNRPADVFRQSPPLGFGPEWSCAGTSAKGGGFCLRTLPPPRKHAPR